MNPWQAVFFGLKQNLVLIHWADLYRELLTSVVALANDTGVADKEARIRLRTLAAEHLHRKPPTRAAGA